jgi:hypothetical protein
MMTVTQARLPGETAATLGRSARADLIRRFRTRAASLVASEPHASSPE